MGQKIKVIVVDDSKFIRTLFTGMLSQTPDIEVVDTAEDPFDAREKIKKHNPDIITLDVEMPKMDGISFLEKIMRLRPMPVIMVSTLTQKGADTTLKALELGAFDYLAKPTDYNAYNNLDTLRDELADKIRSAANAKVTSPARWGESQNSPVKFNPSAKTANKIIAIAASTGGVEAIKEVLVRMPSNCPPIIITQHMPEKFTESFARRLNTLTQIEVCEARDGQKLECGKAYIAPGGMHLTVKRTPTGAIVHVADGENVSGHKPSADVMFKSVANIFGKEAVGVILTGMGRDGADGLKSMAENGAINIGQDSDTCVVYGMPKAAKESGAITNEYPIDKITEELLKHCV
ncbi:MAG: chemotaxis response regulator protein-glutamate methylesterase [Rickettsiales bacterium]